MAKPGFFAPDVETALRQRAAWFEGLGDSVILDSENLDSGSEQWDGESKDVPVIEINPVEKQNVAGSLADLLAANFARVEAEELNVRAARAHFTALAKESAPRLKGRPEPPAARLKRLQKEVATLTDWAAAREDEGQMQVLCRQVDEMGVRIKVQRPDPQSPWLPPDTEELPMLAQLVQSEVPGSYNFQATSGWLLKSQAELLPKLQARLDAVSALLGSSQEADGTLSAETQRLAQRLQRLEDLQGEALAASAGVMASQMEVCVAEAKHLEAITAEQEKEEQELSKPVSPTSKALAHEVETAMETADAQVQRLFEELEPFNEVLRRAKDMEEQLSSGDVWRKSLEVFVQDLCLAEVRSAKACELLKLTAQAAADMKASTQASSQQLQKNVEQLQAKLSRLQSS